MQHFWVAVSMVFFMAATMFTLLKLSGMSLLLLFRTSGVKTKTPFLGLRRCSKMMYWIGKLDTYSLAEFSLSFWDTCFITVSSIL
jgi:hypothetical protein